MVTEESVKGLARGYWKTDEIGLIGIGHDISVALYNISEVLHLIWTVLSILTIMTVFNFICNLISATVVLVKVIQKFIETIFWTLKYLFKPILALFLLSTILTYSPPTL